MLPLRAIAALASAVLLAGCGFRPVYIPTASGKPGPAERELAAIHVDLIPERLGQKLRQDLQERFGSAFSEPDRYSLSVDFSISGEGIGILPSTIATRTRLIANASWTLTASDGTQITIGAAHALDSLSVLDQQYFVADMDNEALQARLASDIADQIAMQLVAYFRRQAAVASR